MTPPKAGDDRDGGFTMIEVVVALAVLSVVMGVTTAGMMSLLRADRSTTAIADAQTQVGRAFLRLDSELRYAADMRVQDLAGVPSLLYLSTGDRTRCYALSLTGDRLLHRQWDPSGAPGPGTVLVSGVSRVAGTAPFTVTGGSTTGPADEDNGAPAAPKEATVRLVATAGGPAGSVRRELHDTFLAPNTVRGPQGASLADCAP